MSGCHRTGETCYFSVNGKLYPVQGFLHLSWAQRKSFKRNYAKKKIASVSLSTENFKSFLFLGGNKCLLSYPSLSLCLGKQDGNEIQYSNHCYQCWIHRAGSMCHCLHLCRAHTVKCPNTNCFFTLHCGDNMFLKSKVLFSFLISGIIS